jgi:hypothetical protein
VNAQTSEADDRKSAGAQSTMSDPDW